MKMKKVSVFLISLLTFAINASAQIEANDDGFGQRPKTNHTNETRGGKKVVVKGKHYNYELSVGLRAGLGLSSMSESDGLSIYDGSGLASSGGLAANVRFGGKDNRGRYLDGQGLFGVGLELNYKNYTIKTLAREDLKLGFFEVPVLLQLYPMYNSKQLKNLYVEVGPTICGSMSASPDYLEYNYATYKTGDLKGFDVKATIGIGYRLNKNSANDGFYFNARYNIGMSKLAENFPGKVSAAEISIGYLFKCIGTKK